MKDTIKEIKDYLGKPELIIGYNAVLRHLKHNELEKIFTASNIPPEKLEELEYYAKFNNTPIEKLSIPNDELGAVCRKQFFISVIAILKGSEK